MKNYEGVKLGFTPFFTSFSIPAVTFILLLT